MIMEHQVRIHLNGEIIDLKIESGTNLLELLHKQGIEIASPCGGNGTCGKCRVKVKGISKQAQGKELRLLGEEAVHNGYRLACYHSVEGDIEVFPDESDRGATIMTQRTENTHELDAVIKKEYIKLAPPDIHDQKADLERVLSHSEDKRCAFNLAQIRRLSELLRSKDFQTTLITDGHAVIGVEPGDTTQKLYGMAVDIGTTTIAAYLMDLNTGQEQGVYSCMNPQRKYGADVISRINYSMERSNGLQEMNESIIGCMNQIVEEFAKKAGIEGKDIYAAVFVGNTTMMHLLMGLPIVNIAAAPFIPVSTGGHRFAPEQMGLAINEQGVIVLIPSVSAYIGADTVAAVVSSGMHEQKGIALLVDIGTNGEIVLGNKDWMFSCSVAAGPAFEGAQIRNGTGGIQGAIDTMHFNETLTYTTIGDAKAVGICGSGIVDAVAGMLKKGIIDEMGRIVDADELSESVAGGYGARLIDLQEGDAFLIEKKESCDASMDIVITQRDVREIQNAKAAVAAGIITLVKESGIQMHDIENVYLAGGFGSYLNIESSLAIGLLPKELTGKVKAIGNAAGSGAVDTLLSCDTAETARHIGEKMQYIELSSNKGFIDEYIDSMMFSGE